ncbi:MAG: radical SAM protein [Pseudomonadota bacterium]
MSCRMFDPGRPYGFHIELTDKCNAGCPMCPRTNALDFCKPNRDVVHNVELGLADFERHFSPDFCRRVSEVIFGGAFGDPLAGSQLLPIVEHLTEHGVKVAVSTNGGLRKPDWWQRLGEAMKRTGSRLELHLDGLADTNHLYRVNTRWDRIMANARAYIETGARAEWHFIIFRHNEHQIAEAHRLSREMGFASFTLIDTIRFSGGPKYHYVMPGGEERALELPSARAADYALDDGGTAVLERPVAEKTEAVREISPDLAALIKALPRVGVNGIDCKSAGENRAYISAHGQVSACCWVTGAPEEASFFERHGLQRERYNIRNRSLEEILLDEPFASHYATAWAEDSLKNCRHKCGRMLRNKRNTL